MNLFKCVTKVINSKEDGEYVDIDAEIKRREAELKELKAKAAPKKAKATKSVSE